jgi:hypothetical protein
LVNENTNAQVEIFNALGQNVYQANVQANIAHNIDLSAKGKGMYIARLTSNGYTITKRFVIE